jgi:predicted transcriptional regulator
MSGTFTIRGFAHVDDGSITLVEANIDGGGWLPATGTDLWEVTVDSALFGNGPHALNVRAWSLGGEVARASTRAQFNNIPLPPLVYIISPLDCGRVSGTIHIAGSASSLSRTVERVDVRVDDFEWGSASGAASWRLSFDTTTLPNGVHRIQARAWDGEQFSVASRLVIIENVLPSIQYPASATGSGGTTTTGFGTGPDAGKGALVGPSSPSLVPGSEPTPPAPVSPAVREPPSDGGTIVVPAFSWGFLLVAALALGTEHGKFAIYQMLFVPLYSRIRKDAVLDNFTRGMIYGFIMSNPGVHYNFIKQKLGLNNGSIVYHLTVLERQELIKSEKVGLYKRFYPVGLTLSETGIMELNETQERLLDIVRDNPGLTQRELAERMNLSTRVINYHVGLLQRARLVSLEKAGKVTKCYATERMPVC